MDTFREILSKEEVTAQIRATEANICRLSTQIDELVQTRQKERRTLARLYFMIVPVGKLPTELLVEIFSLAVEPESDSAELRTNFVGHKTPPFLPHRQTILLSHVCSAWREIAIGSSKLWAMGLIDVRLNRQNDEKIYLDGLQTLLDRSSPLPISVSLTYRQTWTSFNLRALPIAAILHIIAPTTSRWKFLNVADDSLEAFKETSLGSFTALQGLRLEYRTDSNTAPIDLFWDCPHLRHLTMMPRANSRSCSDLFRLPWDQLTHLNLVEWVPPTCRAVFLQCRNLVSATLSTKGWDTSITDAPATALPCLKRLEMQFDEGHEELGRVGPFFTPLILSALHSLRLTFDSIVWPAQEFSDFQMRAPNIAQIHLECCPITSRELITLLRLTPALMTLTLIHCLNCIDIEFLHLFNYDKTHNEQLTLHLQELRLEWISNHIPFDPGALEGAIRSRWWTDDTSAAVDVARLKKVTIGASSFAQIPLNWMEDLVEQGLELNIVLTS
ncbi:hypothetical protein B0H19DRAFT_1095115 [Mycena capillaripes]|nr:hypothetical protein B0H19DRAFT_1095115 [Mycena capillaripes]